MNDKKEMHNHFSIFFLHSNINIYLAKHFIKVNDIDASKIIIMYDRSNFSDVENLPGRKIAFLKEFKHRFITKENFNEASSLIKKFIKEEIRGYYNLIIPHFIIDALQIFAANKNCKKVYYIEEGDFSYISKEELLDRFPPKSLKSKIDRFWFSKGILYDKLPFPKINKAEEAICLNGEAFQFRVMKKTVFDFRDVFVNENISFSDNFDNSIIFLIDPLFDKSSEEIDIYYNTIKEVFKYIKSSLSTKIFFKAHPYLYNKVSKIDYVLKLASEEGVEGKLINDPIELILVSFGNVRVVSHKSSLLRYSCYARVKPIYWGSNIIKDSERKMNAVFYRFLDEYADSIEYI